MARRWAVWIGMVVMVAASSAMAEEAEIGSEAEGDVEEAIDDEGAGFVARGVLQLRANPIGLSLLNDVGYQAPMWDSESLLLDGTTIEGGVTTGLSPAFGWAGPYVEWLPLAVLELRASFHGMQYFGTFGYLYELQDEDRTWDSDALSRSSDEGLGQSASGWMAMGRATPQILLGRVVATGETSVRYISMDMEGAYYEPYFDILMEPDEVMWKTRPTVGYLLGSDLARSYLLVGARYERVWTRRAEESRDIVGAVWNWKLPPSIMTRGAPELAGFVGAFVDHSQRGDVTPYGAVQWMMEW